MGDNSPDSRAQDELDSTPQPEATGEVAEEVVNEPEEETIQAPKDGDPSSSDAVRIVQAASHHLRDRYTLPPYLHDASLLVDYIEELQDTIKALETNKMEDDLEGEIGPSLKTFSIKKQIKVKRNNGLTAQLLEDNGEDSFSKGYSIDGEDKHPLLRRRVFHQTGPHLGTSLTVHSRVLVNMLMEIIVPSSSQAYERLLSQKVRFHQPYVLLFQNRGRLQTALANEKDDQKAALLRLLLGFMEKEKPGTWKKLDEIEAGTCEHVSFEDAWLLYAPGTTIFTSSSKTWEAHKVHEIEVQHLHE